MTDEIDRSLAGHLITITCSQVFSDTLSEMQFCALATFVRKFIYPWIVMYIRKKTQGNRKEIFTIDKNIPVHHHRETATTMEVQTALEQKMLDQSKQFIQMLLMMKKEQTEGNELVNNNQLNK